MSLSALVLAGARPGAPDPVAEAAGVAHKALAEIDGKPMLQRVVEAIRAAGIARCAVAGNHPEVEALARRLECEWVPARAGPSASVAAGFELLGAPLLVTTADHALLQSDWITDFVADTPVGTDVAILLAHRAAIERAVPGSRRTYLRFADGEWSGCNLFLLATEGARDGIATWSMVEADRKRPWRIAARLGPATLWAYWRGRLTLADTVQRLGDRLGFRAAAVAARDGLAAVDVDRPKDLDDARRIAAARRAITCTSSGSGST
ncbi:nucleotidyltransferase family protein [Novosphingobium aquimarinum]|uniref:nucleotidyltransferase family protein n=1 Tax=Novosphingobium aquimarinum TaxID=2682494 RepID=UPI0012EB1FFE|nr:nucleotidyltransferase family protein [Novosphingobium aquimarinum]